MGYGQVLKRLGERRKRGIIKLNKSIEGMSGVGEKTHNNNANSTGSFSAKG